MRFYDRETEQQLLDEVLRQSKREARMTVLMGRRRIGKTELSLRCGDDTILFSRITKNRFLDVPMKRLPSGISRLMS
ncbi:MAG: hypothetical protein IKP36_13700 [Bacteroidaceae bacterium]|jgi:hypothetical protein|nr:hypothetical protein [Bacteroidaceae bacterium]